MRQRFSKYLSVAGSLGFCINVDSKSMESISKSSPKCFGKERSYKFELLVSNLMEEYKKMGCSLSLKMHFLHFHLNFFTPKMGDVNEGQDEMFHRAIDDMEKRYQGWYFLCP